MVFVSFLCLIKRKEDNTTNKNQQKQNKQTENKTPPSLKVSVKQNLNLQSILQHEEPQYWINIKDQLIQNPKRQNVLGSWIQALSQTFH